MKERVMSIVSVLLTYFYDVSISEQNLTDLYIILTVIYIHIYSWLSFLTSQYSKSSF